MRVLSLISCFVFFAANAHAVPTNIGYSGAPGRGTCASTCHGTAGGTVQISGFPAEYVPDSTYLITIQRMSGLPIKNFNGSIRRLSNNQNAGLITGGQGTSTYNTAGETNGIHLSTFDQVSATFSWTAPAAGAGNVRLYVGAHQGSQPGPNTTIQATATELVVEQPPEAAANPSPPNAAMNIELSGVVLSWTPGDRAETHDIFFGSAQPLEAIASNHAGATLPLTGTLLSGTVYFWRVDSRNDAGVTPGPEWSFTTGAVPDTVMRHFPADGATQVPLTVVLDWSPAARSETYNVCFGTENPPPMLIEDLRDTTLDLAGLTQYGTTYYWGIAAVNEFGTSPSAIWSFVTEANAAGDRDAPLPSMVTLGPAYPNPFNAQVTIPFALPATGNVSVELFDIVGRSVGVLFDGMMNAGAHAVKWNSASVGTGVYFVKLSTADATRVEKIVSMK